VGPTAAVIFHLPGSPKEGKCHLHLDLLNCGINVSRKLRARILSVLGKGYHHCHSSHALGTLHSFSITWSECSYPSSIRIVFSHTLLSDSGSHFHCDFFFLVTLSCLSPRKQLFLSKRKYTSIQLEHAGNSCRRPAGVCRLRRSKIRSIGTPSTS